MYTPVRARHKQVASGMDSSLSCLVGATAGDPLPPCGWLLPSVPAACSSNACRRRSTARLLARTETAAAAAAAAAATAHCTARHCTALQGHGHRRAACLHAFARCMHKGAAPCGAGCGNAVPSLTWMGNQHDARGRVCYSPAILHHCRTCQRAVLEF